MQVMAVEAGAVLDQHLPEVVGHESHCPSPGEYSSHHATPAEGTRLAALLGTEPLDVPTYHHQAVRPESLEGTAYRPAAWHADGTLEGDGGPGVRPSASPCSGTPRRARTGGCSTPSSRRPWRTGRPTAGTASATPGPAG